MTEITIKPTAVYALLKSLPYILLSVAFTFLAYIFSVLFLLFGIATAGMACYRFLFLRCSKYLITNEVVRISRGIFIKRIDQVEMYRIKDYIITQTFFHQVFKIMNLTLKSTDPENPVVWMLGIPVSDIVDTIRDQVQETRQHNRIYELN